MRIPYGGYVKITNSAKESPLLGIINIADIAMSVKGLCGDLKNGFGNDESEKLAKQISIDAFGNEVFANLITDPDSFSKELYKNVVNDITFSPESVGTYVDTLINNLNELNLTDLVISSAESVLVSASEKAFTSLSGPAGTAMKGLFAGVKAGNLCVEVKHFHETLYSSSILIQNLGGENKGSGGAGGGGGR